MILLSYTCTWVFPKQVIHIQVCVTIELIHMLVCLFTGIYTCLLEFSSKYLHASECVREWKLYMFHAWKLYMFAWQYMFLSDVTRGCPLPKSSKNTPFRVNCTIANRLFLSKQCLNTHHFIKHISQTMKKLPFSFLFSCLFDIMWTESERELTSSEEG